ncbi:hypothetical protein [Paracoccus sp. (in: a-proteobacteria)]|uniref:hypothetical protein n=1 Tax=Paracoccus sp. TaxID=267 RepID=UPI003A84842E
MLVDMHVGNETLSEIFAIAEADGMAETTGAARRVGLECNVSEGAFCDILPPAASDAASVSLPKDLSMRLTRELDPKMIEHSKDGRMMLRCTDANGQRQCEVDRGSGWQEISVR